MAFGWLSRWLTRLLPERQTARVVPAALTEPGTKSYEPRRVLVRRHWADGDAPPLHWSACHPSTMSRFKAQLTCSNGHGLTIRSHRIGATGAVFPSVVCPVQGCSFHEFVVLGEWSFGSLPSRSLGFDNRSRGESRRAAPQK